MTHLTERYQSDLLGVLSCYDRMIITGTLPGACYSGGMTSFLNSRHIRIFDYARLFADPWRERLRQCAHEIADAQNVSIEHVNKSHIRKEDLIAQVIKQRGKCIPGWCTFFQQWKRALPINPGMTKILTRPFFDQPLENVCITIFTSSTKRLGCVICAYPPGVLSACSFIAMVMPGLKTSFSQTISAMR